MKNLLFIIVSVTLFSIALQSCESNDEKISKVANSILSDNNGAITATVADGVVTLSGTVLSEDEKYDIEDEISSIKDVKKVINNLVFPEPVITKESEREADIEAVVDAGINKENK